MATKQERYDASREAIIKAGRSLLSQKDAAHVSVAEIMKVCGLSPGLFYHYFESKDAFIVTLATENWATMPDALEDPDIPIIRRLREHCMSSIRIRMGEDIQLRRNLNAYKMSDIYTKERERLYRDDIMFNWMRDFLNDCIAQGFFSPELPVDYIAKLLLYVVHGIDFNASLYKREWDDWAWVDQFFDFVEEELLKPYQLKE